MKRLRFPFPSIPAGITRSFSANTTHSNNNSGTDFYSVDISSLTETDAGTTLTHKGYFSSLLTLPHQLPDEIFFFTADPHSGGVAAEESSNRPSSYLPPHHNSNSNQYGKKHARPSVYCRLCGESVERSEVKSHITGIFNYLPYSHAVRHVLLECLTLLALRGFPIGKELAVDQNKTSTASFIIEKVFEDVLRQRALEKGEHLPSLVRHHNKNNNNNSLEERSQRLLSLLFFLTRVQVLDISLSALSEDSPADNAMDRNRPHTHTSQEKIPYRYHRRHHALPALQRQRRRLSFERVEYLGDCSWGHFLTDRMLLLFPQQQWGESKNAIGFNAVKTCVEMNLSLEFFFDFLDLQKLVQSFYSGTWWAGETAYFNNHHNGSAGPSVQYLGSGSGKLAARLSNKNKNNNNNNNNNENSGEKQVEDGARKIKADVVEAILGELHLTLYHLEQSLDDVPNDFNDYSNFLNFCAGPPSSERLVEATVEDYRALFLQDKRLATTVIRHCLNEFYDLVMLFYIRGMIHSVLPIANEMAAYSVWGNKEIVPLPLRHQKQFRSVKQQRLTQRIRYTNNNNDNYKEESVLGIARPPVGLPPLPRLFPSPVGKTKLKEEETPLHYLNPFLDDHNNNKYETIAAYYPQCINENLKQDVFARFEQSYKTLHLVSKNRKSSFIQGTICPAWSLLRYTLVPLLYLQEQEGKLDTPGELNINNSKNNNNSPPLPLFALQTPEEALQRSFFRDAFYSLKEMPSSNNKNNMNHNSVLEYLKQNSMTAEPITKEPVSNHNHHQTNNNAVKVAYHFSRYVPSPDAVRHASAVVADKTYFKGVFAFLGTASLFSKNNPTESEFDPFSILSETKNEKEEKKLSENKETTENNNNNDKVEEAYRLWKKEHYTLVYNSGKMKEYFD